MSLSDDNESSLSNLEDERDEATKERSVESNKSDDSSIKYDFGWNRYSEITNGRFAMIGFLSILIIEILSKKSFFSWAGILN